LLLGLVTRVMVLGGVVSSSPFDLIAVAGRL
jgi:hypothetical protein